VSLKQKPEERGPGADRFNRLLKQRAPEKLEEGKHMLYEHALRCFCKLCGSLLNWECPAGISYTETECCGLRYRLQPWTVKVWIEDISARPMLPQMEGSNYSDPDFEFGDRLVGTAKVEATFSKPFSAAQQELSFTMPTERPQVPQAPKLPEPAKPAKRVRRCGICRQPGHTRRKCPEK
jgi:hypothetical protein